MNIMIILGTAREGRQSEKVANFITGAMREAGAGAELIDVRDYKVDATDNSVTTEKAKKLEKKINETDAIIIVAPEYNFTYPGELKMMLDMLYKQYFKKPVGLVGVSGGAMGGIRMTEHLKSLCLAFGMIPMQQSLLFPKVQELFDESGEIKEKAYEKRANDFFETLKSYV